MPTRSHTIAREQALALDAEDSLAPWRERFTLPEGVTYFDGKSLGALPKAVPPRLKRAVGQEWGVGLIRSWNDADWYLAPQRVGARIAQLTGAAADEVIVADSTSANLFKTGQLFGGSPTCGALCYCAQPLTDTGTWLSAVELFPSWPEKLAPQHWTPAFTSAQVWKVPAVRACTPLTRPVTGTGTWLSAVELLPSSP